MPSFYRKLLFCSIIVYAAAVFAAARYGQLAPAAAVAAPVAPPAAMVQTMAAVPTAAMQGKRHARPSDQ